MLRAEQYDRLANLTDAEARSILRHHLKIIVPDEEPCVGILRRMIDAAKMDQRRVLLPLFRTQDPTTLHAIETIVGRPITRIQRATKHAPTLRLSKPRVRANDPRTISNIAPNPKKLGSASAARYDLYRDGMTVSEALDAGITSADLKWDEGRGYVVIT